MTPSLRKTSLLGAFWMLIQKLGVQASTLVVFVVLARILDARDFGLMAMANVFILFLSVFAAQGLTSAIIQRQELEAEHLNTAFWLNLLVGVAMCGLTITIAPWLTKLYQEPEVTLLIWVLSGNIILESLVSVQNSILQRQMAFKRIAARKLSAELIAGAAGITLAFSGFGVWSLVVRSILSLVIQMLMFWWVTDWRPRFAFSASHAKDIFGYGINVLGVNVLNFCSRQLDDLLVGAFLGATILGQYTVAKRLILTAVDLIRGGIGSVAWTMFSKIQNDTTRLRSAMLDINRWVCIAAFPLFISLSLFSNQYIPILFGEKWLVSAPIITFLALAGLFEATRSTHESLILAVGESGVRLKLAALLAFFNLSAFFVVYPFGIERVTLAYFVIGGALFPLWSIAVIRLAGLAVTQYLASFKEALIATSLVCALHFIIQWVFPTHLENQLIFAAEVILLAMAYGISLHLTNRHLIRSLLVGKKISG